MGVKYYRLWPSLQGIAPNEMFCLFLNYLANEEAGRLLEYQFRISEKAISYITDVEPKQR